jgi:hypothetical protein
MINKKISKVLGPILGIMGFMLATGVSEAPVLASGNGQANVAYTNSTTAAAVMYKDYSVNINKSAEQNGVKVTIDKAIATKHKLKVTVKIESDKPFDTDKLDNSVIQVTFGENYCNGRSWSYDYPDDKTMVATIEQHDYKNEFLEKGNLRVDAVLSNYKVNVGIDAAVDFSECFKNTIEKDISSKMPKSDCTLNKLETSVMGTIIDYSEPYKDDSENNKDFIKSSMILKVGDKMYKIRAAGSRSSEEDNVMSGTYEAKAATYDRVKDQKDISIIPVVSSMSYDDLEKIYKQNSENESNNKKDANKETTNNVSYEKSFEFSDGSKGEIYNIERNDNSVKVYCKGTSDKESLLMASNMNMYYQNEEDKKNQIRYDSNSSMSFYKDSKDKLGYVVEFDNVEKDKVVNLNIDNMVKQIDKFEIGDEIQISK